MHSRIFQVSRTPIETYDYIEEMDYIDHWFTNSVADYVSDNCNRNDDIEWLKQCRRGLAVDCDENGEYLMITSKTEYFSHSFERFKKILNKIKDCTLEEFSEEGYVDMWGLKNEYEEKFGFYIDNDGDLNSLDSFVRRYEEGKKYYIGGTVDYHC